MARVGIVSLFVGGVVGARVRSVSNLTEAPAPIPLPEGYTFNMDMVHGCYSTGASGRSGVPPGYKKHGGKKCPGERILTWADGSDSLYGHKGGDKFKDPLECAKECNAHDECSGFYTMDGLCSWWRTGELQDLPMIDASAQNCYVQWEVRDLSGGDKKVVAAEPGSIKPSGPQVSDCLCVWDIDRTLTAKQGWLEQCPGTKDVPWIKDYAYNGGTLILSDIAQNIKESFCGQCYFAAVSAGTASGPASPNRDLLDTIIDPKYNVGDWVDGCPSPVWGTKVMCCGEGEDKKQAVRDIVSWLGQNGVHIADEKVHFFDDKANNIEGFMPGPFNAHQVSCESRDSSRGGCGGVISEVVDTPGQHLCP